ncbi:MAG: NAD(P)H-dependent oxidoreductase [Cardiobacteriaceae bacterium]|nr:NAD(P)H-dependent oxidoreductase [Cardiobacteriaceae bacterium]
MTKRVLLLFAHPALHSSRLHSRLLPIAEEKPHITVHDLYATYPDEFIFPKYEQSLLNKHDVVLMQFPFYWFSTPGILKSWQDVVLQHGYAFGEGGNALRGKYFGTITSTGGKDYSAYRGEGRRVAVRDYLLPLESMAGLCNMKYLPPFVIHDARRIEDENLQRQIQNYSHYLDLLPTVERYFYRWKNAVNISSRLYEEK